MIETMPYVSKTLQQALENQRIERIKNAKTGHPKLSPKEQIVYDDLAAGDKIVVNIGTPWKKLRQSPAR
jgi:hypothetical protein